MASTTFEFFKESSATTGPRSKFPSGGGEGVGGGGGLERQTSNMSQLGGGVWGYASQENFDFNSSQKKLINAILKGALSRQFCYILVKTPQIFDKESVF